MNTSQKNFDAAIEKFSDASHDGEMFVDHTSAPADMSAAEQRFSRDVSELQPGDAEAVHNRFGKIKRIGGAALAVAGIVYVGATGAFDKEPEQPYSTGEIATQVAAQQQEHAVHAALAAGETPEVAPE